MIVWTKNNYCSETIMHAGIDRNREKEREREREHVILLVLSVGIHSLLFFKKLKDY